MTHQTGITASTELKDFLATSNNGCVRLIKIGIVMEELVLLDHQNASGTWEDDYNSTVLSAIQEKEPCYIFYRLDSQNELGYEWLFIPYSPDDAETRQKMLFAATRSTIKMEFGGGHISEELFGTVISDVNLDGFRKHIASKNAAAPLTSAEEELNEVKQQHSEVAASGKANTLPGISFPMDDNAITELIRIAGKEISYVQLQLDIDKEIIYLVRSCDLEASELAEAIPSDKPSYNFFIFKHTHEGDFLESLVFISSMPSEKCSIKEKMLYSSCKAPLLSGVQDVLNVDIVKKIEIGEGDEINSSTLQDDLHPQKNIARQKFAKPKGPGGRGAKRLIKKTEEES